MDALKKADREFKCNQTTAHTAKDACKDIEVLTAHLLENKVTSISSERTEPAFEDPTETGMWIYPVDLSCHLCKHRNKVARY